jgi:hypothetical protein
MTGIALDLAIVGLSIGVGFVFGMIILAAKRASK